MLMFKFFKPAFLFVGTIFLLLGLAGLVGKEEISSKFNIEVEVEHPVVFLCFGLLMIAIYIILMKIKLSK